MKITSITEAPKRKFGKLGPRISYKTPRLRKYLTPDLPEPPANYDVLPHVYGVSTNDIATLFPMDGNDVYGDCTIAALAHAQTVYNGLVGVEKVMNATACTSLYFNLTGGQDSGLDELTVLDYWKSNAINGDQILGFASVNVVNRYEVKQAITLFGGIYIGFQCQANVINEFDWHQWWKPGPLTQDGHAVYVVGYDEYSVSVLTWGGLQVGSWGWWNECVDEAYAILPPQAKLPTFAPGFDFAQLQADLGAV